MYQENACNGINEKTYQVACKSDCIFGKDIYKNSSFIIKKITYVWDKQQNNKHFSTAYLWPVNAMQFIFFYILNFLE